MLDVHMSSLLRMTSTPQTKVPVNALCCQLSHRSLSLYQQVHAIKATGGEKLDAIDDINS